MVTGTDVPANFSGRSVAGGIPPFRERISEKSKKILRARNEARTFQIAGSLEHRA
jgi:hypothetical protein